MAPLFESPYLWLKVLHYMGILLTFGALVAERSMYEAKLKRSIIKKLSVIDAIYGLGAIMIMAAALTLWLTDIGKPTEFYSRNSYIYVKLVIFSIIGILSLYPTIWFLKNRNGDQNEEIEIPKIIGQILNVEIGLMLTMPIWAVLMVYA